MKHHLSLNQYYGKSLMIATISTAATYALTGLMAFYSPVPHTLQVSLIIAALSEIRKTGVIRGFIEKRAD